MAWHWKPAIQNLLRSRPLHFSINNVSINFSTVEREERIKDLVEKKKAQRGNKAEEQKSKTVNVAMAKKSAVVRRCRLYIGWLHRSSADSRYKQIKTKDGGVVRDFCYNDDELPKRSGKCGWKVNGSRLFGSFYRKISWSNGTSGVLTIWRRISEIPDGR